MIQTSRPSNIALIKYMGKENASLNRPTNSSLSYTLEHLRTFIEIAPSDSGVDCWEPLRPEEVREVSAWGVPQGVCVLRPTEQMHLSLSGREKYLRTLVNLRSHFGISRPLRVRTINNFPSDCGIASSASSFAALTLAVAIYKGEAINMQELGMLSARGSGSSSRSFLGPWCSWHAEGVESPAFSVSDLVHGVFLVSEGKKRVSSSEAHQKVMSSLNFRGRVERAEMRHQELTGALTRRDWKRAKDIVWAEFWDMHSLFETASEPFGYFESGSLKVLSACRDLWDQAGDGPLVTMDAGANVHVLFRPDQGDLRLRLGSELLQVGQIWSVP